MTTASSIEEAETIANVLVAGRLAACVQILPQITSIYQWRGELHREAEHMLLIKTADERFAEVEAAIRANHSYDVPEIVAIKADNASEPYLAWLTEQTR